MPLRNDFFRRISRNALVLFALPLVPAATAGADELEIIAEDSIFAVVTHKAGLGARLAHNHLIAAAGYEATLAFDPDQPGEASFTLTTPAADLVVDDKKLQERWYPHLEALGILDQPFGDVDDKDRGKIREAMLGKGQLDAESSKQLTAEITAVSEEAQTLGETKFPHTVTLALEVQGKKVEKNVAARHKVEDGILTIEAAGTFAFTDFGIEPYSAFLGAVKNEDVFHLYVHLAAKLE